MKTRNSDLLASFVAYCEAHPDERFWQALRNWCGWGFVFVGYPGGPEYKQDVHIHDFRDTYYWEENEPPSL